jgi:hypothetical protein
VKGRSAQRETGRSSAIAIAALVGCGLGLGSGCRSDLPATEIVVTIDTTFGVPCTIDALHIEAVGEREPVTRDLAVGDGDDEGKLPGSITLYPLGDPREVTVTVTAMRAGEPFATATDTATFDHERSLELRFVLDRSCVPGPCPAVGLGRFVGLPAPEPRRGCGDESYARKNALFVMRDACSMREALTGSVLPSTDEHEQPSPLLPAMPFPFWFYGAPVTQIWVGDNGYIGLGDTAPDAINASVGMPRPLGDRGTFPGKGVLPFWDDLRTSAAGVCFAVSGAFPDRILWITWKDACFASTLSSVCGLADGTLTFGVALEETTDRIFIGYRTMVAKDADRAKANRATIGITDAVPRGCTADLCSSEGTCQDGRPCGFNQFSAGTIVDPLPTLEFDPL